MQSVYDKYEAVIGLEVHTQMLTSSKAYSNDRNEYGSRPNTNVSAITLGHPGTLPRMNKKTIEYAIKLGLALNCEIAENQYFARKNYFYPDRPKGYQITQDTTPICTAGYIDLKMKDKLTKRIGITRIHMEEDAGKSIHDVDVYDTLVDLNRAGTPLLEIVTEPDFSSADEAYNYLTEIRQLVRYLDICDGNMEEGSMRCDANVSVRKKNETAFGTKVEVKNMNSIRNVHTAISYEIKRQIDLLESGGIINQETRSFDAVSGSTISMRTKEAANDYRYFPEPDLAPLKITDDQIAFIRENMPVLPRELFTKYTMELGLSEYDANILISSKSFALFFEEVIKKTKNYKGAANWMIGDVRSYLNQKGVTISQFPLEPEAISKLVDLIDSGKISNSQASQKLFPQMIELVRNDPGQLASELNLLQDSDENSIKEFIQQVIIQNPQEIARYQNGEKQLIGFFMGQLMKLSKGKVEPKSANALLREMIENA